MNYYTILFSLIVFSFLGGCDSKVEDEQPDESLLRAKQIAKQFNAKIVSKDIDKFHYTADFQDYFSDSQQPFMFVSYIEDILKQDDMIMAKFGCNFEAVLFLEINNEMLHTIRTEENWGYFIVIATIDRVCNPFWGLSGNIDGAEINVDDYGDYTVVGGAFYVEVVDAPIVLHGECVFIEQKQ